MTTIQALNQLLNHHKAPHRAVNFASPFFVSNVVPQCAILQLDSPYFFVVLFLFSVPEAQSKTMVRHIVFLPSLYLTPSFFFFEHNLLLVLLQVYSLVCLYSSPSVHRHSLDSNFIDGLLSFTCIAVSHFFNQNGWSQTFS